MPKNKPWLSMLALGVASAMAACTSEPSPTLTATPTVMPTNAPTPTLTIEEPATPTETPPALSCPEQDWIYQLDYTHEFTLEQPGHLHLEMIAEPGSAFFLTIRQDGTIDSDDFENAVLVSFTGTVEDCVIEGENKLFADIFGLCFEGIATLQIDEHFDEGFLFTETCPEGTGTLGVENLVSAPENQFDFDLKKESDTKTIEMDTGILSFHYSWTLHEYGPAVLPLVPTPQD